MIWESVQGLGALVGLATGVFVLWERLTKNRPDAFVVALPFGGSGTRFSYLRVVNTSPRPILLSVDNGSVDGELRIAEDHSARAIIRSVVRGASTLVIDGGTTRDFPLIKPPDFGELDADSEMLLKLKWQFAQPYIWRQWQDLSVSLSKRSYKVLASDYLHDADDD